MKHKGYLALLVGLFAVTIAGCSSITDTSQGQVQEAPNYLGSDAHGTQFIEAIKEDVISLPGMARAQQGIMSNPNGYYYTTENKGGGVTRVSTIYKLNSSLSEVVASFSITAADLPLWDGVSGNYHSHFGQAAYNEEDEHIYVTIMDTGSKKSGLLEFDEDTQFVAFYDWSRISPYFDSIAFRGDELWFDYGVVSHISLSKFKAGNNTSNIDWTKYDVDHSLMNTSQGIRVVGDKFYYVPENDPNPLNAPNNDKTLPDYRGVAVFNISSMNARVDINVPGELSYPEKLYRFQIPETGADHEAMDFVIGSTTEFYISTAADSGENVYKVRIE